MKALSTAGTILMAGTLGVQAALFTAPLMSDADKTYRKDGVTYRLGYYDGSNEIPPAHRQAGLDIARSMVPLDRNGQPDPQNGTIRMVIIGHSIPRQTFLDFNHKWLGPAKAAGEVNPRVVFEDSCVVSSIAKHWVSEFENKTARARGICGPTLQVLVIQTTWTGANGRKNAIPPLHERIETEKTDLIRIAAAAVKMAPNLKMILLNSEPYQGHATATCNKPHEPYHGYEEAFNMRRVIMDQINGDPDLAFSGPNRKVPYFTWGGDLWDPEAPRSDYANDCVHLATGGRERSKQHFMDGLKSNPVVAEWCLTSNTANNNRPLATGGNPTTTTFRIHDRKLHIESPTGKLPSSTVRVYGLGGALLLEHPLEANAATQVIPLHGRLPARGTYVVTCGRATVALVDSQNGN